MLSSKASLSRSLAAAALAVAASLNLSGIASAATKQKNEPTFVLVHGALFSSAGWSRVQGVLQERGYNVVTLDVPGRNGDGIDPKTIDIQVAAEKVRKVAAAQNGPVILVGHSQGGALITQAADALGSKVKGLVYIAAVAPHNGQTAFEGLSPERDKTFPLSATPTPEAGLFVLNPKGPHESSFFQDLRAVDAPLVNQALALMVSEPIGIGTTKLKVDEAKLKAIPKFYVEAIEDRVVSIETQRAYQASWGMKKVYSHKTGHSPFLSQPRAVADNLEDVLKQVSGK